MVDCILHSLALSLSGVAALASRLARVVINNNEMAAIIAPVFEVGTRSDNPSMLVQLKFILGAILARGNSHSQACLCMGRC